MRLAPALLLVVTACGGGDDDDGWQEAPMLAGPIQETATVTVGDDIWVLGGLTSFVDYSAAVWIYDTAARAWSAGPTLPLDMHHANAAVVDGSVYIVGYLRTSFTASGEVYRHTPDVDTGWVQLTSMPAGTQRGASITAVMGGRIYVVGGLRGAAVDDVSAYDPVTDTWDDEVPDLPLPRDHGCGGVVGGSLVVAGGRQGDIGSTTASVVALGPSPAATWTAQADMPTARGGTACGVVGDRLIVVGGEGNPDAASGVFPQTEAFDGTAWTTLEPMRTPRHGMAAAAIGPSLYVPGGATQQAIGAVATHETFTP